MMYAARPSPEIHVRVPYVAIDNFSRGMSGMRIYHPICTYILCTAQVHRIQLLHSNSQIDKIIDSLVGQLNVLYSLICEQ